KMQIANWMKREDTAAPRPCREICNLHFSIFNVDPGASASNVGWCLNLRMRSVPRAVATGSPLFARIVTRSLPLSVLTPQQSFCKLRHHSINCLLAKPYVY